MASFMLAPTMPAALCTTAPRRAQRTVSLARPVVVRVSASDAVINKDIEKDSAKVVTMCSSKEINGKGVFCRCWKSGTFPLCDGAHMKHNKATGDNVGPLIISMDSSAPINAVAGPLASTPELKTDPMEEFCGENADADECRVYED